MIKDSSQNSIRKAIALSLLLLACLVWTPSAMAEFKEQDQIFDTGSVIAMLDADELSEQQLGAISGQGTSSAVPVAPSQWSIILWDEGGVKKGNNSNTQGYGNSVVTVKVHLEGR